MHQRHLPLRESVVWTPPDLPSLDDEPEVTIDCETTGLHWFRGDQPVGAAISLPRSGRRFYVPWGHRGGQNLDEATVRRWFEREFRGKRLRNLATTFDVVQMRGWGIDFAEQGCTFHDVAHSAALLDDHRRAFTLEALSHDYLGLGKEEVGPKTELGELSAGQVAAYAIRDVELVDRLCEVFAPKLSAENLGRVSSLEDAVIPVVCEMQWNGVPIREDLLDEWLRVSEAIAETLAWDIAREVGFQVNPDKATDLARLFLHLHIDNPNRTATGQASFSAAFMQSVEHPTVKKVFRLGKLLDLRSKYLVSWRRLIHNGKLYGTFHQLKTGEGGTVSGRFSSSGPNLQNVMTPGKQRRLYGSFTYDQMIYDFLVKQLCVPDTGHVWACADQAQVEFRYIAHFAECAAVDAAYREDIHTNFHKVVDAMVRPFKPDIDYTSVKVTNFQQAYGGKAKGLAETLHIRVADAYKICDAHCKAFPEFHALIERATAVAEARGWVHTLLGRRGRFPGKQRSHKALNAVIQGCAADDNKLALVDAYAERKRLGLVMRTTVHDELNGDLQDAAMLPAFMEVLNRERVPLRPPIRILWEGKVGDSWASAK